MATGGSIESIGLKGRTFAVAADADSERTIGGSSNETSANGDGTARLIKTRVTWMVENLQIVIDDLRGDHEYVQGLADLKDFFEIDITYASGAVWNGPGQIVGDIKYSSNSTTAGITLSGSGKLAQQ